MGPGLGTRVWPLFGPLPARIPPMRGAPVALPTFATVQFRRFFDYGRAVWCLLPLGAGGFMHLVVLYGYQGADTDAEQLALTDKLFDAALGELSVVARGQPSMIVGDFNVEPTKIPCLAKGISAGLWVDFEESWALTAGLQPAPTCKRAWSSSCGNRRDFMGWLPPLQLLFTLVKVSLTDGLHLILLLGLSLIAASGLVRLLSRFSVLLFFGLLLGCLMSIRVGGSKSVEVQRVWGGL